MAEPMLTNKDLDLLISSLEYAPGDGLENAPIPATADNGNRAKKSAFTTFIEMDAGVAGRGIQPMRVIESASLGQPDYPDAATGSFGIHNLELIIGNDDRKRVTNPLASPWRKIAGLVITSASGSEYAGTAWFISRRVLVTAGHCLFLHDAGGFAKHIEVVPCWHDNTKPFGSHRTRFYKASNGWVNDRNSDFDYGVIILEEPADERIGYFAFAAPPDDYLNGNIVNVCGYPADRDKWPNPYYHAREISRSSKHKIYYDADSTGGQSGAGLWMTLGEDERVAIGIHTTGTSTTNYGTRITAPMYANFKKEKNDHP